jgi:hypothetical protein
VTHCPTYMYKVNVEESVNVEEAVHNTHEGLCMTLGASGFLIAQNRLRSRFAPHHPARALGRLPDGPQPLHLVPAQGRYIADNDNESLASRLTLPRNR